MAALVLTMSYQFAAAQPSRPPDESISKAWPVRSAHPFHDALKAGKGFSCTRGGSALAVTRQVRAFPEFEAVEYTVRFKNEGKEDLPALSAVNAIDLTFEGDITKGLSVITCGGGGAEDKFPPKDFAMETTALGPPPAKAQVVLGGDKGKSSLANLPFFFTDNPAKAAGIFVGVGWTGQWKASIQLDAAAGTLRIHGGVADIDIKLKPGEEIAGPSILVGCYRGTSQDGTNALRRLIRDRYLPTGGKGPLLAPVVYSTWFDIGADLDEKMLKSLADVAAEIGQEVFLVDAGWYKGTPKAPYTDMQTTWKAISEPLGNWEDGADPARFPSGLAKLADYVRSKGMRMGLWFEPERCGPDSRLAKEHPDWVIYIPKRRWGQVDFGSPGVPEYFCKVLDRYIKELGLRYIRWDMNQDATPYWAARDTEGRKGITQIRHLEGVHAVEDWLVKNHPDVILESCAGGGNRIDLPTIQRRGTIWISDQIDDPQICRFHVEGLNRFIPGNMQCVAMPPNAAACRKADYKFPDITFQTCFAGAFGSRGRLHEWPQAMKDQVKKNVEAYKKVRKYLSEDFYALAGQLRTLDTWSGWQFHDPKAGEGFVQVFRLKSAEQKRKFPLKGLDAKAIYEFTDVYTGKSFTAGGDKLCSDGLEFDLPEMSSRALLYRVVHKP